MKATIALGLLAAALIAPACTAKSDSGPTISTPAPAQSGAPAPSGSSDNGQQIFLTGRDRNGVRIGAVPPALRPSCAACHQQNGAGGVHLPGGAISADLRHSALVTHQKHPYTVALLERAIAKGVDNDGKPLDPVMPHWRMSPRDLHDVAVFVYTKLK